MSDASGAFVVENREHLLGLLAEAAEIEHNLMCCYLYAAFSLKEGVDEDLSPDELDAVRRWRRTIVEVAIDEMAHLALVANLTSAVGGVPHFERANFPIAAGYHPAGIVVKLAPFNFDTLEHFIYLERPEGSSAHDGAGFEPAIRYRRISPPGRLMPTSHDYDTVGELYHGIRGGLESLTARLGEPALFLGDPSQQIGPELASLPGLTRVRCLKTALAAVDGIVVQGEGAPGHTERCHYQRFLSIREEFEKLRAARPAFRPGRPAAHNPVMRRPPSQTDRVLVEQRPAADLLDLVNAAYNLMLRLLVQGYAETRGEASQRALIDAAIGSMFAISPIASALTRLPASPEHPGCTAGMSFATVRGSSAVPAGTSPDRVLVERARELATRAAALESEAAPGLSGASTTFANLAQDLERGLIATAGAPPEGAPQHAARPEAPSASTSAPGTGSTSVPTSVVVDGVETVEGKGLTLLYEVKRCIHARHCVLGEPSVFKANVQGPWLDPDATSVEHLVTVAHLCPSGAIRYRRKDGGPDEAAPLVNLIQIRENGPLGFRAELRIDGAPAGYRATLCRCGGSKRKPFCDGTHVTAGFSASGEPATRPTDPLAVRSGPLEVRPLPNGPLSVSGNVEICAGTGRTVARVTQARLCRCGHSANKPFCDGTHARVGFRSD